MLDAKFVRTQPDLIAAMLKKRHLDLKTLSHISLAEFVTLEQKRLDLLHNLETLKAKRNQAAKDNARKKSQGKTIEIAALKQLTTTIQEIEDNVNTLTKKSKDFLLSLPNLLDAAVPVGRDETFNKIIRTEGPIPEFSFPPKPHFQLGSLTEENKRAASITGARFTLFKGVLAKLARALSQFFLDENIKKGYTELLPATIANEASLTGTAQLPKFANDVFRLSPPHENFYLISTSEIPLVNYHANEILNEDDLPLYYTAYTSCYRSEAGAAGKDTRGLIRLHEFHKTELVQFVHPTASQVQHEKLLSHSEHLLKKLNLPYRVVLLASGDIGFAASKCYDLEVWLPGQNTYREIASCSNCLDFQARRANIRYRTKKKGNLFVHTLNSSGLPIERTMAAILENFQTETGTVHLPAVLHSYMGGCKTLF
ncbi:serine--tRNA ligase [Spirochaetota bacterium]|nr:serine--tRNA ligase [Spirochaetota bacterium]